MKKFVILGVSALALTGCVTATPTPTVTVTATPPPVVEPVEPKVVEPEPTYSPEELFIGAVEDKFGPLTPAQEVKAIKFAKLTCKNFDTYGVKQTLKYYADTLTSRREAKFAGFIVGAGAAAFCPEYGNDINGTSAA